MSIFDKIGDTKRQYDEMDPFRRHQLQLAVIGSLVLIAALYLIINSFETLKGFFNR